MIVKHAPFHSLIITTLMRLLLTLANHKQRMFIHQWRWVPVLFGPMSINTSGDCRYALEALSSSCWSTEPCSCDDTPRYFKGSANCSSILFQGKAPLGCSRLHHSVSQNYQKLGTDSRWQICRSQTSWIL